MPKQFTLATTTAPAAPRSPLRRHAPTSTPSSILQTPDSRLNTAPGEYLTRSEFARLFTVVTLKDADPENPDSVPTQAIQANLDGFYSTGFISAYAPTPPGVEGGGGGTSGGGLTLQDVQLEITNIEPRFNTDTNRLELWYEGYNFGSTSITYADRAAWADRATTAITATQASNALTAVNADTAEHAAHTDKLATPVTLWGNTFDGSASISGSIAPDTDRKGSIGSSSKRWNNVWGINIRAAETLRIGNALIQWDAATETLRITGANIIIDRDITANGNT